MKADARVQYTKTRITEAFYTLLEKKSINRISVRELCELAEINRATFYNHYADVFDLMEKLEDETMERLCATIRQDYGYHGLLRGILRKAKEPQWKITLLCGPNGDPSFSTRISEMIYRAYMPIIQKSLPDCSDEERQTAYRFIAGGSASVITGWIKSGMEQPPDEMDRQLLKICEQFIRTFNKAF